MTKGPYDRWSRIDELVGRIQELENKNKTMERALHTITNQAHPKQPEIFKVAMEGLGLETDKCVKPT